MPRQPPNRATQPPPPQRQPPRIILDLDVPVTADNEDPHAEFEEALRRWDRKFPAK